MGKGMTVKNLFLGFVAVILTVCLIGLLILATNEDALAKVHKTINTLNAINVLLVPQSYELRI